MTTVRARPAPPDAPRAYPAAPPYGGPQARCDEVLAARLADFLLRLEWLGATVERLLRRLVGRPAW